MNDYITENEQSKISNIHVGEYSLLSKNISIEEARNILGIAENKKVILFFGYIRRYKGLDILLESVKILKEKHPEIFLIVAGKDIEGFNKYQKIIDKFDIEDNILKRIEYIPVDETSIYFSAANVVVLPYRNIYQSGVVYLAYAHSKPVIVTNVGGLPDITEDGKSGYIVEPNNPEDLAGKIDKMFVSPSSLEKMGEYGYQMAKDKFSWEQAAEKTFNLYLLLLKNK